MLSELKIVLLPLARGPVNDATNNCGPRRKAVLGEMYGEFDEV